MDIDAIAAVSMRMSAESVEQALEITMLKKAMELQQTIAAQTLQALQAVPVSSPSFGHKLDVLV